MVEKTGGPVPRQKFNLPSPRPQPSTPAAAARCPQTRLRRSSPAFAQPGAPAQHPGGPSLVPLNPAPKVQPGTRAGPPQVFSFCQLSPVPESIGFIWENAIFAGSARYPGKSSNCTGLQPQRDQHGPRRAQGAARHLREPSPALRDFVGTQPRTPARYHRAGPAPPRAQPDILATFADPARYLGPVPQD